MFITCKDFIKAGLWNHQNCCQTCHHNGTDFSRWISLNPSGDIANHFPDLHIAVCCGFAGQSFTKEQIEKVIQCAYGEEVE